MNIRPLSKELQKKAIDELGEDPERLQDDVNNIKTWLKQQHHIHARTDDQWLVSFLRGCKFSLERTKEKLDMYYTVRTIAPEFYGVRDPMLPEIQEILKLGLWLPLPKTKEPDSPRVLLMQGGGYDPVKYSIPLLFKVFMMFLDVILCEDDNYVVAGVAAIQDLKGVTMAHMTAMTPSLMKQSMTIFQDAMPIRPKIMHHINIPSFFETIYNMMKMFMKEKLKQRTVIHGSNYDSMYDSIPREILPKEYGGEAGTMQEIADNWKAKVESYREWFLEDAAYKTIESKRPGKPKSADSIFGVEGSFRKLNVD